MKKIIVDDKVLLPVCPRCGGTGDEPKNKQLGAYFARKRKQAGVSQRQIAVRMACSNTWVNLLERGEAVWSTHLRTKYLEALAEGEK